MIKVLEQGAFVSDKVAVVNFSGWERMIIKCEGSKKTGQGAHSLVIVITGSQATAPSLAWRAVKPFLGLAGRHYPFHCPPWVEPGETGIGRL